MGSSETNENHPVVFEGWRERDAHGLKQRAVILSFFSPLEANFFEFPGKWNNSLFEVFITHVKPISPGFAGCKQSHDLADVTTALHTCHGLV